MSSEWIIGERMKKDGPAAIAFPMGEAVAFHVPTGRLIARAGNSSALYVGLPPTGGVFLDAGTLSFADSAESAEKARAMLELEIKSRGGSGN